MAAHGQKTNMAALREAQDHGLIAFQFAPEGAQVRLTVTTIGTNSRTNWELGNTAEELAERFWGSPSGRIVLAADHQYRLHHTAVPPTTTPVEARAVLDATVEAVAYHLTGPHPKHRVGMARLARILRNLPVRHFFSI